MIDAPGHLDIPRALAFVRGRAEEQDNAHVLACRACSGLVLGLDPAALERLLPSTRLMVVRRHLYSDRREGPSGGMGRTYTAIDERLGRRVLIKEVLALPDDDADEAALQPRLAARLAREARITARLQHPNIVSVYEAGRWSDDGTAFYAMEYAGEDAVTLAQAVGDAASVKARLAFVPVVTSVARAIAYAHARGVVHRDLTPANILLAGGRTDSAVVVDWGVAVELGSDPRGDVLGYAARDHEYALLTTGIGTPGFMAPEQARGAAPSRAVDVFGLGALLYFVVTGRAPFVASEQGARAPLPQECPPGLAHIIEKALAREPVDRYPDAQALVESLVDYQSEQLIDAPRARRWVRRVAALLVPIAVLGGLCGYLFKLRDTIADERRIAAVQIKQREQDLRQKQADLDATEQKAAEQKARANEASEKAQSIEKLARESAVQLDQTLRNLSVSVAHNGRSSALVRQTQDALRKLTAELETERVARRSAAESQTAAQQRAAEAERASAAERIARLTSEELRRAKEADLGQIAADLAKERAAIATLRSELAAAREAERTARAAEQTARAAEQTARAAEQAARAALVTTLAGPGSLGGGSSAGTGITSTNGAGAPPGGGSTAGSGTGSGSAGGASPPDRAPPAPLPAQDPQTQDPQTQDPQTQDPQTRDPQTRDPPTAADRQ